MTKPSVLIVDDDSIWCEALRAEVEKSVSFQVHPPICRGQEALDFIMSRRPDILILDMLLPDYDGLYIINFIQMKMPKYRPFIYIVSTIGADQISRVIERLGVNFYSIKPIRAAAVATNLVRLYEMETMRPARSADEAPALPPTIDIGKRVDEYLYEIGAPLYKLSTKCTQAVIVACLLGDGGKRNMTAVYQSVGEEFTPAMSSAAVDRNIRSTVKNIREADKPAFHEYFPDSTRLANAEFINMSVYHIKARIGEFLSDTVSLR